MPVYKKEQYGQVIVRIKEKIAALEINMGNPLAEEEILRFETHCNIRLPEAYRMFLKEIGNGCVMIDGFRLMGIDEMDWEDLSRPFMLEKEWIWEDDTDFPEGNALTEAIELMAYNGEIELIDLGDAMSYHLIVSGKCRGEVWNFTDVGVQPCCERQDFLGWFELWLDHQEDVDYFKDYTG